VPESFQDDEGRCESQVYNLPETVRESDVEKLSFAVQLAEGFYANSQVHNLVLWPGI
jgi:hypothetical protein